jgi:UDP-N-acetyl-2-amino-2-deoxyglucuronate dehydrogenase
LKNFAITGVGGYVAPRHLQAIRDTGNHLIAALDPHDAVGILDRYFENVEYFREFERFDRFVEKMRRRGESERVHYVSICSPNYLHDAHIRFALRVGANAICEKPLVLNPWNLDALAELEKETGKRVYNVLQLRVHPSIVALKRRIEQEGARQKLHELDLTYITTRGHWYYTSWKGDVEKSGGIATNIGVHFFDMLTWVFGAVQELELHHSAPNKVGGFLRLERATARWFLSLDRSDLPEAARAKAKTTYRSFTMEGEEIEFSDGFADLHTEVYRGILDGRGYGIEDARSCINTVHDLRKAPVVKAAPERMHPFLRARR